MKLRSDTEREKQIQKLEIKMMDLELCATKCRNIIDRNYKSFQHCANVKKYDQCEYLYDIVREYQNEENMLLNKMKIIQSKIHEHKIKQIKRKYRNKH
jgi:hypothetical protein